MDSGHPGNCRACEAHFKKFYGSANLFDVAQAQLRGTPLPVIKNPEKGKTPCNVCPKWALHHNHANPGLLPKNELPVRLYYLARREQRVGTMAGAFLMSTMTPMDALAVIDAHDHLFATDHEKEETFELMTLLDQTATQVQGEREERQREREKSKNERKK